MEEQIHFMTAKEHFIIAEDLDKKYVDEKNSDKKVAYRIVAAQNYFYSLINMIEAILAKNMEKHSFNHENRIRNLIEHRNLFTDEIVKLYEQVDRDFRNKVAYRGENGKKYESIKKLAKLLIEYGK